MITLAAMKYVKKIYDQLFQNKIIKEYNLLKSIRRVAINNNITTRQVINILNDNQISHNTNRIKIEQFFLYNIVVKKLL